MSTSCGPQHGWSKAAALAYVWLIFYYQYPISVNFGHAWTSLDMRNVPEKRVPLMMLLASAVDDRFWVNNLNFNFLQPLIIWVLLDRLPKHWYSTNIHALSSIVESGRESTWLLVETDWADSKNDNFLSRRSLPPYDRWKKGLTWSGYGM